MRVIGITGGIGAGKSVVSRILRCRGFEVYDCDAEARRLMDGSPFVHSEIAEHLGADSLHEDGSLNRGRIAAVVFADPAKLSWLNSLVHTLVRDDIAERIAVASAAISEGAAVVDSPSKAGLFFVESAILASSGLAEYCNEIWLVDAPEDVRIDRACRRDGCDPDKIRARIRAQQRETDALPADKIRRILNLPNLSLLDSLNSLLQPVPEPRM